MQPRQKDFNEQTQSHFTETVLSTKQTNKKPLRGAFGVSMLLQVFIIELPASSV